MEKDIRDSFERIEKRLNAIEDLGKAIKTAVEELATDMMDAQHGDETKLERILQSLEAKK
jgi:chaperonin cofactor prefoldin